jgi:hypothetical protein
MSTVNELTDALRAVIISVDPAAETNGIYRLRQLAQIPFERKVEAGQLPLYVLSFAMNASSQMLADGTFESGTVTIYRIYEVDEAGGGLDGAMDFALTLKRALYNQPLAAGEVMGWPSGPLMDENVVNAFFLMTQRPLWADPITVPLMLSETVG